MSVVHHNSDLLRHAPQPWRLTPTAGCVVSAEPPPLRPLAEVPAEFRECTDRIRVEYRELYEQPVLEGPAGTRTFHKGALYRWHGLNVLVLRGDFVEMAFQHGRLLAEEAQAGAAPQSARMVERALLNAFGQGAWQQALAEGVHHFVTGAMLAQSIRRTQKTLGRVESLDEAAALSDATGIPVQVLVRALFNPETMLLLANAGNDPHQQSVRVLPQVTAPACCCSSFAAWGPATLGGRVLIGRNMDYPLNGYYDRFPTVIYYHPTVRTQRFMSFVSAGVQNAGLNGYNESGIFISSHTVPTKDVAVRAVPVFTRANLVIRRATSFDMAVELFREMRPPTGWAYFLASVKERRFGTVELSHRHVAVREATGDFHVQTNHFLTPEMREQNMFLNSSVAEDNDGRYVRLRQLLEKHHSHLDVSAAISVLGDQFDPVVGQVRGLGNTVGVHTTMTSLVLDPDAGRAFVAAGSAPACHNDYVEVPLIGTRAPEDFAEYTPPVIPNGHYRREHPQQFAALQLFIQAKAAFEFDNDDRRAYELLQQVVAQDSSNPAYFFQLGIFALRIKQPDDAIQAFSWTLKRPYLTGQLRRLAHYYRGRAHGHLGRWEEGLRDLQVVLDDADTDNKLRAAAQSATWRLRTFGRYRLRRRNLMIMMQQSDMLHY